MTENLAGPGGGMNPRAPNAEQAARMMGGSNGPPLPGVIKNSDNPPQNSEGFPRRHLAQMKKRMKRA